jgi:hypothetical protein
MNRGQLKRIRKEVERLCHCEKEWEALQLISREGAVDEFSAEWTDLWRGRIRHALRTAAAMEEFLTQLKGFPNAPDTPDLRLLKALDQHLAGRDARADIGSLTGLSAPAETLRRELVRLGNLSNSTDPKLAAILNSFALTPEAIAQKDYRRVGELLASSQAGSTKACDTFKEILTRSRKLNSLPAVRRKADGVAPSELRAIDRQLSKALPLLPKALADILAAPVLAQIAAALTRIAESGPDQAATLALCAPVAMDRLAGPAWPDLRKKFSIEGGTLSAEDRVELRKSCRNAGFEERFRLINKLADLIRSGYGPDQELCQTLVAVYQEIFKDLTQKRAALPEREQRRLAAVLGPVFSRHLPILRHSGGHLPRILDGAAEAGCLDPTLALLHTFFAVKAQDIGMTTKATAMLTLLPPIREKEMEPLFNNYLEFIAEDLKSVKAMLVICRETGHELDQLVAERIGKALLPSLIMNTLSSAGRGNSFMAMLMGPEAKELSRVCKKMLKGMNCFADNPSFSFAISLAQAFPDGKITGALFGLMVHRQLEAQVQPKEIIDFFSLILFSINQITKRSIREMGMPFGNLFANDQLLQEVLLCGLDALCDDPARIASFNAANLSAIVDIVKKYCQGSAMGRYLLLIGNTLPKRAQSGDEAIGRLHADIMDYLALHTKPAKKGKRR